MRADIVCAAVVSCGLAAQPTLAQRVPFEKSLDAAGISMLDVSTLRGNIHVVAGDPDRIVVSGAVTVRVGFGVPADAVQIAQRLASHPPIEHVGNTLRLRPPPDATARRAVTVNYDLRVPRDTQIVALSDSGAISLEGSLGNIDVRTQSGAIELSHLTRSVTIATGSGGVTVDGAAGPVAVTTSSSAFTARGLGGALRVRTGSGAVDATFAGADDADVETSSSAIRVRNVRGAVTLRSGSGHIAVDGQPARAWAATTGSGGLDFAIEGPPFSLDLSSGSGSVEVLGANVNGTVSKRAVRGDIGGAGPAVRVSTRSGSIRINVGR